MDKIDNVVKQVEKTFGMALIIGIFVLIAVNVVLRYVFSIVIMWSEVVINYMFVWMGFLSIAYILGQDAENNHISVDILFSRFSKKVQSLIRLIFSMILIIIFVLYVINAIPALKYAGLAPALNISNVPFYSIIPIWFILMIWHSIFDIRRQLILLKNYKGIRK